MPIKQKILDQLSRNTPFFGGMVEIQGNFNPFGESNFIESQDINKLIKALRNNDKFHILKLPMNPIGDDGIKEFAEFIKTNTTIRCLNLQDCNLTDVGIKALTDALKSNHTLKLLELQNNFITEQSTNQFIDLLRHNHTLVEINLDGTMIGRSEKINLLLRLNNQLSKEKDPIKKANVLGRKTGIYKTPSLVELGIFAVKTHVAKDDIELSRPKIEDSLYRKLTQ